MAEYGQNYKDNPKGFTPARFADKSEKEKLEMYDTLSNLITSLGTSGDKRTGGRYDVTRALRYDYGQLTALYRENWIAGKMIDAVPEDMTRSWRRLSSDEIPPEDIKKFEEFEEELNIRFHFNFAHKMARLYGGSVIVLAVDGTGAPDTPLELNMVKKGSLKHMKVVDLTRMIPGPNVITNPLDAMYGQPEFYRFAESGVRIHHSRLIRFDGIRIPFQEYRRNAYWHDSILNRLYGAIRNMDSVVDSSASLVYESNIDVIKLNGMMDYMQSAEGTAVLTKRMMLQKQLKASTNQTVIDKEDDYTNVTKQFTGLPSLIDRFLVMLTAGSDTPAGRILGDSASAFDVSGSGNDLKNYYDTIRSQQVIDYNPKLRHLDKILAISLGWGNKYGMEFEWNSLFQKTPEEEAKAEKARAEVYSLYKNNGVMNPSLIAKELQNNPYFENITKEWVEELMKQDEFLLEIENQKMVLEVESAKASIEATKNPEGGDSKKPGGAKKDSNAGNGKKGKPDPKKQNRDLKSEGSKDINKKNQNARSRTEKTGTEKEQV